MDTTTVLSLGKNVDGDSARTALNTNIPANMDTVDALFHATTGHKHTGAGTHGTKVIATDLNPTGLAASHFVRVNSGGTALETADIPSSAMDATIASGEYTPTITAVANVAANTPAVCYWQRIGSYASVTGQVNIDPTTAATSTAFRISLPVASNFAASTDAQGMAAGGGTDATAGGGISANSATDDVTALFFPAGNANQGVEFHFMYKVI